MISFGILKDVFEIHDRGSVLLCEFIDHAPTVRIKDRVKIGDYEVEITGIEMVGFRDLRPRNPHIGLLVKGQQKKKLDLLIGQKIYKI